MSRSLILLVLMIISSNLIGGCSPYPKPQNHAEKEDQRAILNEGYSLLYKDISGIAKSDLIFLVKVEADTVEAVAKEVANYADKLKKTLEKMAEDYPAVDIKLSPMCVIEERTRSAVKKDRILSLAPIIGLSNESFERRVLQSLEGPLNQFRFLCKVLEEEEPEPGLKRIIGDAQKEFERLYEKVLGMLNERYFINAGEKKAKK